MGAERDTGCLTSTETVRLFRDGEKGGGGEGVMRWEKREDYIPT